MSDDILFAAIPWALVALLAVVELCARALEKMKW
jgi:hypothetical protein